VRLSHPSTSTPVIGSSDHRGNWLSISRRASAASMRSAPANLAHLGRQRDLRRARADRGGLDLELQLALDQALDLDDREGRAGLHRTLELLRLLVLLRGLGHGLALADDLDPGDRELVERARPRERELRR